MTYQEKVLYRQTWIILIGIGVTGIVVQGWHSAIQGIWELQLHPARLINDYTIIANTGAALVNAVFVAGIGLVIARVTGVRISGPVIAAVYTMLGFGLFGKTPMNSLPIILGVYLSSRIARTTFDKYLLIALFGTALAPVVSAIAVEVITPGITSWVLAVAVGIAVGIILPPTAMVMLRFHQGFNLYNIGLTSGFLGLFVASLVIAAGGELPGTMIWNESPDLTLFLLIPVLSLLFIILGLLRDPRRGWRDNIKINTLTGRLPSDFMDLVSIHGSLVNMGILGFLSWGYCVAVGAPLNGPVLGGIFTIIGFGAFGKHVKNCLPVMTGVFVATLVFQVSLTAPGAILALLFGTTLAPIAGEFGFSLGFVAGFIHLAMVSRSGAWHTGMSLYNNGFAGGLTATLMAAAIEWYQAILGTEKKEKTHEEPK